MASEQGWHDVYWRYTPVIYIGYISDIFELYRIFSILSKLDIFHIFQRYFITVLDVKTSLKCENRISSFQYCLLFNFKTFLQCDAHTAKRDIPIVIILSSPILKYTT